MVDLSCIDICNVYMDIVAYPFDGVDYKCTCNTMYAYVKPVSISTIPLTSVTINQTSSAVSSQLTSARQQIHILRNF